MHQTHDTPTGPALRMELIRLLAPLTGDKVVEIATLAESYILGQSKPLDDVEDDKGWDAIIMPGDEPAAVKETDHDRPIQTPVATPDSGRAEEGDRGGQSAEGGDLCRDAVAGNPADDGNGESGDPAPAQGPGQEDAAQDLTSSAAPSRKVPQGHVQWTPERKNELRRLCKEGLEAKEIEERMGLKDGSAFANAYRFGWIDEWRAARECRRAGKPMPERDVPPGSSWAFTGNKTMAEVMATEVQPESPPVEIRTVADDATAMALEADKPVPPPLPVSEESRLIEEHIKEKGVTTAEMDYGPDQPAVDALRRSYNDVVRSNDPKSPWLVNGMRCTTSLLWKRANADLKARREKPIKRSA